MLGLLIATVVAASMGLQVGSVPSEGIRERLDRIVKTTGEPWQLQRAVRFSAAPGVRNETEIYEWRDATGQERLHISIEHLPDAVDARDRVDHLMVESGSRPLDGIGDAAKIASMRETGPSVVHFTVDWMYVQLSAPIGELAIRLAGEMAKVLRP